MSEALLNLEWRQTSPDRKIGLGKRMNAAVRKNGKKGKREQSGTPWQLKLPLRELAREALWDTVVVPGLAFVEDALEAERVMLCGPRYAQADGAGAMRSGHVDSSLVLGGRRVGVRCLRARTVDGHEASLPTWQAWSGQNPLDERAFEQMVLGVSTRRYARSLEALSQDSKVRGLAKVRWANDLCSARSASWSN